MAERFDPAWLAVYATIIVDSLHHVDTLQAAVLRKVIARRGCTVLVEAVSADSIRNAGDDHPLRLVKEFAARTGLLLGKDEGAGDADGRFAISADGKDLVFVTWNDESTGAVIKYNFASKKQTVVSGALKGIFRTPSFSPDGKQIVFLKEEGNEQLGFNFSNESGIYVVSADGNKPLRIGPVAENPVFMAGDKRILFQEGGYPSFAYKSCDLNGNDERTHFTSKYGNEISVSPDNKWVAFRELYKVYIAAFPAAGKTVELHGKMTELPVSGVSHDAGYNLNWSSDSKKLNWTLGNEYFSVPVNQRFLFLEGAPDSVPPVQTKGIPVNLELKQDKPGSVIVFTNATIISMKGDQVIEKGTLVVRGNMIEAVGKTDEVRIPEGAIIKDMNGKTIMPGFARPSWSDS